MLKTLISKLYAVALSFAFLISIQSCKKNDVQDLTSLTSGGTENKNIAALQQAVANSFNLSPDKVVYNQNEKQFVVDGDGIVSLEDANARFSYKGVAGTANEATQRKFNYVVATAKVNAINIYADATVPAMWVAALDSAIKNWNNSGSKVHMKRLTSSAGATTMVTTFNDNNSSVIASASYPTLFGAPGRNIAINIYYGNLAVGKKIFAITHELGHAIGLSHTDETIGSLIANTPAQDANSVMNSVCVNWEGFSKYDLAAVRTLYPRPMLPGKKRGV